MHLRFGYAWIPETCEPRGSDLHHPAAGHRQLGLLFLVWCPSEDTQVSRPTWGFSSVGWTSVAVRTGAAICGEARKDRAESSVPPWASLPADGGQRRRGPSLTDKKTGFQGPQTFLGEHILVWSQDAHPKVSCHKSCNLQKKISLASSQHVTAGLQALI